MNTTTVQNSNQTGPLPSSTNQNAWLITGIALVALGITLAVCTYCKVIPVDSRLLYTAAGISFCTGIACLIKAVFISQKPKEPTKQYIPEANKPGFLDELAPDTLNLIFSYLPPQQVANCSLVSKTMSQQSNDDILWKHLLHQKYPHCVNNVSSNYKEYFKKIETGEIFSFATPSIQTIDLDPK